MLVPERNTNRVSVVAVVVLVLGNLAVVTDALCAISKNEKIITNNLKSILYGNLFLVAPKATT